MTYVLTSLLTCLDKPRYLNMTSVLTLPAHMSGFLHELGSQSGVYRSVLRKTVQKYYDSILHLVRVVDQKIEMI